MRAVRQKQGGLRLPAAIDASLLLSGRLAVVLWPVHNIDQPGEVGAYSSPASTTRTRSGASSPICDQAPRAGAETKGIVRQSTGSQTRQLLLVRVWSRNRWRRACRLRDPTDLESRDRAAPLRFSLKLGAAPRASMFRPSSPTSHASGWLPRSSARQDSGPIGASRWTAFRIDSPSRPLCSSARLPARAAGRRSGAAFGSGRIGICAVSSSPAPMEQLPGPHFCWRSDPADVVVLETGSLGPSHRCRDAAGPGCSLRPVQPTPRGRAAKPDRGRPTIRDPPRVSVPEPGPPTRSLASRVDARGGAAVRVDSWSFRTASMAVMSHYCDTGSRTVDTHGRVRTAAEPLNPACWRYARDHAETPPVDLSAVRGRSATIVR